jgi:hypothetical protein
MSLTYSEEIITYQFKPRKDSTMADHFGAIASKEIGSTRAPLVFPKPQPKNGVTFPLLKSDTAPTAVYKKPDTREELDAQIEALRIKYEPFFQKLAPAPAATRECITLTDFDLREATTEDLTDFSRVLKGEGDWEHITVP